MRWINCAEQFPEDWNERIIRKVKTKRLLTDDKVKRAEGEYFLMYDGDEIYYSGCEWLDESIQANEQLAKLEKNISTLTDKALEISVERDEYRKGLQDIMNLKEVQHIPEFEKPYETADRFLKKYPKE